MIEAQTAAPARPLKAALTLAGITAGLTMAAALVIQWLAPGMEPMQRRFIAVLALAAFASATVAVTRRDLFTSGRLHLVLLILPLLVTLAPFAGGIKDIGLEAGTTLVIGYLATGAYEELWFRGLVLDSLAQWPPVRAAFVSSALFGLTHLVNIAFGANPAVTAAQVVGATCFGIGLAALRLRGVSLWPLIIIHGLADIALQAGDVTSVWRWVLMVGGDIILLAYGLRILRKASPTGEDPLWAML
jgi:uncharacterized protein